MPRMLLILLFVPLAVLLTACADIERTSWALRAEPSHADTSIDLGVFVGACDEFERFDVRESDDRITIGAYVHEGERSDEGCDDIILIEDKTVEFETPIGDRPLHGCNPASAVYGTNTAGGISNTACRSAVRPR